MRKFLAVFTAFLVVVNAHAQTFHSWGQSSGGGGGGGFTLTLPNLTSWTPSSLGNGCALSGAGDTAPSGASTFTGQSADLAAARATFSHMPPCNYPGLDYAAGAGTDPVALNPSSPPAGTTITGCFVVHTVCITGTNVSLEKIAFGDYAVYCENGASITDIEDDTFDLTRYAVFMGWISNSAPTTLNVTSMVSGTIQSTGIPVVTIPTSSAPGGITGAAQITAQTGGTTGGVGTYTISASQGTSIGSSGSPVEMQEAWGNDPITIAAGCTPGAAPSYAAVGGLILWNTFNGHDTVDTVSTSALIYINQPGTWYVEHNVFSHAFCDFLDTSSTAGNGSATVTESHYNVMYDNGIEEADNLDSCHPDVSQNYQGSVTIHHSHNLILIDWPGAQAWGDQGYGAGDNFFPTWIKNTYFDDNLILTYPAPPTCPVGTCGVSYWFDADLSSVPTGDSESGSNNWILPNSFNFGTAEPANVTATAAATLTASISGTTLTVSACGPGSGSPPPSPGGCSNIFHNGQFLFGTSVPANETITAQQSGTTDGAPGVYTLSVNAGTVSSETMQIGNGAYLTSPGSFVFTGNVNVSTGAACSDTNMTAGQC